MTLKRLWYICTIVLVLGLVFFMGYMFGTRDLENAKQASIEVTGPNNAKPNSLSEIQVRAITGSSDAATLGNFGQFYYKQNANRTEILIRLGGVPLKVVQKVNKQERLIPKTLSIQVAKRSLDGLDYEYVDIGQMNLDEPNRDGVRSGEFFTTLDFALLAEGSKVERIILKSSTDGEENIYLDSDANLPLNVRGKPAPFFWVVL